MKTLHQIVEQKTPKFPIRAIIDTIRGVHVGLELISVRSVPSLQPGDVEIEVYPVDINTECYVARVRYGRYAQ